MAQEVRPTAEEFEAAGEPGILVQRWTKPEALRPHRMVEDSLGEWLHWKDHIAALAAVEGQRDGFLAEVERLRTRERHLETEVGHLHDDVRRLRTCLEDADEQRDALADALQKLLRLEPAITTARNGGPTSEAWCRWEEAKIAATKALRKAGRP